MSNIIHLFKEKSNITTTAPTEIQNSDANQQLSLPFNAPHISYVLIGEIDSTSEDFLYFINEKGISTFFDLRLSPRLDFVAPNRKEAFIQFQKINVSYYDVFGRFEISSPYSASHHIFEILKEIVSTTENISKHSEPVLLVFDNHPLAHEYSTELSKYFDVTKIDGKYIRDVISQSIKLQM